MTGSTIVIRLRAYRGAQHDTTECFNGLRDEAADEIERLEVLEKELAALRQDVAARSENERNSYLPGHLQPNPPEDQ